MNDQRCLNNGMPCPCDSHNLGEPEVICHCGVVYTRNECETNVESEFYQARLEGEQPDINEFTGRPIPASVIKTTGCPRCDPYEFYSPDPDAELEHMKETGEHWRSLT